MQSESLANWYRHNRRLASKLLMNNSRSVRKTIVGEPTPSMIYAQRVAQAGKAGGRRMADAIDNDLMTNDGLYTGTAITGGMTAVALADLHHRRGVVAKKLGMTRSEFRSYRKNM